MTNAKWSAVLAIGLSAFVACDRSSDGGATGGVTKAAEGPPAAAAWTNAGLSVSALTKDASGAVGNDCLSGTVSGVDVVVCTFESEQAAKAAEAPGLGWVGQASGASVAAGSAALAVADRRNADPSGRTMNQVIKVFQSSAAKK